MGDNKVSEKAIWEGSIPLEDENTQFASSIQSQPQMMFCYKCNNVIPGNSRYCPYCQVELFTTCPKCGVKYSSQYPVCNQCGTNREEYLRLQKIECERKETIERENRRKKEIQERKRQEEELRRKKEQEERERQERLKAYAQQAEENLQKEAYIAENAKIMKTQEYNDAILLLTEAFKEYECSVRRKTIIIWILYGIGFVLSLLSAEYDILESLGIVYALIGFPVFLGIQALISSASKKENFIKEYISSRDKNIESMITLDTIKAINHQSEERLSECCIIAYRKKHRLNVNYKWHN